jgi:hypothetical protein
LFSGISSAARDPFRLHAFEACDDSDLIALRN